MPDWSAERPCPQCGCPVQLYSGPRRQFPTTVVAGTMVRHYHAEPTRGRLTECPDCERVAVLELDGEFYTAASVLLPLSAWQKHTCKLPTAIPAPIKLEMARLDDTPEMKPLRLPPAYG